MRRFPIISIPFPRSGVYALHASEMAMYALHFDRQLRLVDDYPEPQLLPGEAIIRPHLVGICNTDIELTRGYMGFHGVLGHEFVGTVVACEDPSWAGRRVVGEINAACGRCATCRRGDASHCPERTTLGIHGRDGAMAERFSLPIACLHAVPDSIPDEAAVFVEPLAAALEILQQTHVHPTDRVAVVGDGKLGLLCAQALRLPGCDIVVVGRHPERWELLHSMGIATVHATAIELTDKETRRQGEQSEGLRSPGLPVSLSRAFDVVVDCTGHPSGLDISRRLVRPRGRLVLKSTFASDATLDISALIVDEIQLIGSRCGPFAPALRLLERGTIATEPLIAGRFALRDGLDAFRAANGRLKIVLEV
ncbi:MAG TPA: alcohol dehydrogenase catalytic domain-containing protein [Roseiflexaceae bacterium]|nr:alcohol dehydrogenase catalytic domain-containing protein [Roseiflexaceae bacterium]